MLNATIDDNVMVYNVKARSLRAPAHVVRLCRAADITQTIQRF